MSDNKITQDQLEPNVMEELESGIGDLNALNTENKDSLVAAVTEIYGKSIIADAVGEPLAATDTFAEMGSEINGLISQFKTNIMNAGVAVESGDKFKELIEKIKGLTEGEGNKGIQFTSGDCNISTTGSVDIPINVDFIPSYVFCVYTYNYNYTTCYGITSNIHNDTSVSTQTEIRSMTSENITAFTYYGMSITYIKWYAIGVGEEDTTLRDSLADILENKGVDVTEEDDMASLIGKTDMLIQTTPSINCYSGIILPEQANDYDIFTITDEPITNYILSSDKSNINDSGNGVMYHYIKESDESVLYNLQKGNINLEYKFYKTAYGDERLDTYYYKDNQWNQLTKKHTTLLEDGVLRNIELSGDFVRNNYAKYVEGTGIRLCNALGGAYLVYSTFENKIDFSKYTEIHIKSNCSFYDATNESSTFYCVAIDTKYNTETSSDITGVYNASYKVGGSAYTRIIDISDWEGEHYFMLKARMNFSDTSIYHTVYSIDFY